MANTDWLKRATEIKNTFNLRYPPSILSTLEGAESSAKRMKCGSIILGENQKYWVVTLSDAMRLTRVGYEGV